MNKVKILGLIPARGGSKGIKSKNTIELAGKPLISYVISAFKKSKSVGKIVCTTDSPKIAEMAKKYGAEAPFLRPAELAQDASPVYPALVHAVKTLEETQNYKPDYIVLLQPTYPFVKPDQIDRAVKLAMDKKADSVITAVVLDHDCHPYNIREILPDARIKFWKEEEHYKYPSRQMKPKFYKFGNLFVTSYRTLMNKGKLEGEKNYAIEIPKIDAFDINDREDLEIAEIFIKKLKK